MVLFALGTILVLAYVMLERTVPRGPSEFVSWPPLEPLPFAAIRGFSYEQLARLAYRAAVLGPALLLLGLGLGRVLGVGPLLAIRHSGRLAAVACGIGLALFATLVLILDGRAVFDDELTYQMQAESMSQGRLTEDRWPRWGFELFTIWTQRGATGKYLPGEAMVQVPGVLVGLPALSHGLLLLVVFAVWRAQVKRHAGSDVANWSVVSIALSPMVVATGALGLSQITSLTCIALAGWGLSALARPGADPALGASGPSLSLACAALGWGVGAALWVRPQVAVPMGAILGGAGIWRLVRSRRFRELVVLAVSFGLPAVGVLLYCRWLTGSFLTLPWSLFEPQERYGFGSVLEGDAFVHGLGTALENLAVTVLRLNGWWLGWPVSWMVVAAAVAMWWSGRRGRERAESRGSLAARVDRWSSGGRVWALAGAGLVLFHVPYYSSGVSFSGPIYYFELVLPLAWIAGSTVVVALRRWPRPVAGLLWVHLVLGTGTFLLETTANFQRYVDTVHRPVEAALERLPDRALVLYEVAPQEQLRIGWLNSGFPQRTRLESARVVAFPRTPGQNEALRAAFPDRSCWYYRVDPSRMAPELLECERAADLLERPLRLPGPALVVPSTAMRRGLLTP